MRRKHWTIAITWPSSIRTLFFRFVQISYSQKRTESYRNTCHILVIIKYIKLKYRCVKMLTNIYICNRITKQKHTLACLICIQYTNI